MAGEELESGFFITGLVFCVVFEERGTFVFGLTETDLTQLLGWDEARSFGFEADLPLSFSFL